LILTNLLHALSPLILANLLHALIFHMLVEGSKNLDGFYSPELGGASGVLNIE